MSLLEAVEEVTFKAPDTVFRSESPEQVDIVEEQTEFSVIITGFTKKINVIKVVRTATGLALKAAKDLVESTPAIIKQGLTKDEADELTKILEAATATVEIK